VGLLGRLRSHGDIEDGAPSHSFEDQTGLRLELDPELSARLRQAAERRGRHPQALDPDILTDGWVGGLGLRGALAALDQLTPRQQQVAKLTARGYTNHQIAEALVISPETVKTHIRHVLERFNVASKADLRLRLLDLKIRWWEVDS
jgi:DNA-binding NarL/FixJ family response regulator